MEGNPLRSHNDKMVSKPEPASLSMSGASKIPQIPLTSPSFLTIVLLRTNYMANNYLPKPGLT
jgi:hypothetical protein